MKLKVSLDTDEINQLIKDIENYRDSLSEKCVKFLKLLADEGITIAERRKGEWSEIIFEKTAFPTATGAQGEMKGSAPYRVVQWQAFDKIETRMVAPLLMADFGSGQYASDARNRANKSYAAIVGAGRGTFPQQKHAMEDKWKWQDLDGVWHESNGLQPTMPMYYAARKMRAQVYKIGKKVFKT